MMTSLLKKIKPAVSKRTFTQHWNSKWKPDHADDDKRNRDSQLQLSHQHLAKYFALTWCFLGVNHLVWTSRKLHSFRLWTTWFCRRLTSALNHVKQPFFCLVKRAVRFVLPRELRAYMYMYVATVHLRLLWFQILLVDTVPWWHIVLLCSLTRRWTWRCRANFGTVALTK